MIFQLMHGLFQVPALFGLPRVRTVLQQTPKRSRSSPAQKGVKQGLEDEQLQVTAVLSCNQRVVGILQHLEDIRAYNTIKILLKTAILTMIFCTCRTVPQMCLLKKPQILQR